MPIASGRCCRAVAEVIALLLVAAAAGSAAAAPDSSVVRLDSGAVRGYVRRDEYGAPYLSFRGVPYAAPPLGELRFKESQPVETWSGVLDARDEGAACPQHDVLYGRLMTPRGFSEDCLHANVHAPLESLRGHLELTDPQPEARGLPVLVFIHGGGFGFGSGDSDLHGPEYLVTKGVIVVTFNYRLGALGFLTLESPELPGNLGLRDVVAALRWVRRNIAAFGGDPDNVTVGGQSAGAAAAHLLTLSPMARGLFARGILMSGVATRSWFSTSPVNGRRLAEKLLLKLNVSATNASERLRHLRRVPLERIVRATAELQDAEGFAVFVPVVEKRFPGIEPFLDDDPYAIVSEGRAHDVPLVIGHTDVECETYARRFREIDFVRTLQALPVLLIPPSVIFQPTPPPYVADLAAIKKRYFPDDIVGDEEVMQHFIDYCTDAYFVYPALKLAEVMSRTYTAPVFLYEFAYGGRYSPIKEEVSGGFVGAGHIEDMTYVLRTNSFAANISENADDEWVKDWMTILFSNFMKTSDPTRPLLGGEVVAWPAYASGDESSLNINRTVSVRRRAHADLLPFFDELHEPGSTAPDPRLNSNDNYSATSPARTGISALKAQRWRSRTSISVQMFND